MGRSKKKSSASKQQGDGSVADNPPQMPRKRGRPKKIVEKTVETEEEEEDEEEEEEDSQKKFSVEKEKHQGESSSLGKELKEEDQSKAKPKIVKREGINRRKNDYIRLALSALGSIVWTFLENFPDKKSVNRDSWKAAVFAFLAFGRTDKYLMWVTQYFSNGLP
eukprot:Gb_30534 [translate_table: standard]